VTPLIDWFSCSFKDVKNLYDIFEYFKMNFDDFKETKGNGILKYSHGLWFDGITIYYNKKQDSNGFHYDFFVNMSGQGCRRYETIQGEEFDWVVFFKWIQSNFPLCSHFSRIDIAVDVKDKMVPTMKSIIRYTEERKYISNMRRVATGHMAEEWVYFGSPQSDTRLRIYNKALERGLAESEKWVRFECQLRNESAKRFLNHLNNCGSLGVAYRDFLNETVRYTEQSNIDVLQNHNQSRISMAKWWLKFTEGAAKFTKFETVGVEYNYMHLEKYVDRQAGNMLAAYVDANEGDISPLLEIISRHGVSINDRQRQAVREHKAKQSLEKMRAEHFG